MGNMKKSIVLTALGAMIALAVYAQSATNDNPQVTLIPDQPIYVADSIGQCVSGGEKATVCSINMDVQVSGYGIGGNCSVSCFGDTYACCGYTCRCKPDK